MSGVSCNAEGFLGEVGAVDVLEGGKRKCSFFYHDPVQEPYHTLEYK